jgi:hypothetical protein
MEHQYGIGQHVYYRPSIKHTAAPGIYTIIKTLPVEIEGRYAYRIRSVAEAFERTADESELAPMTPGVITPSMWDLKNWRRAP